MAASDVGHLQEAEFADLELDETDDNEISRQTKQGLPFVLPWHRAPIRLGTCFHSKRMSTKDAWSETTPFILSDLHMIPKRVQAEYGTNSEFKSFKTARMSETGDHLTLGFGVGVGLPFLSDLASVSVKGTYDREVLENNDASKTSIRATARVGSLGFERQPRLSPEAITEIKYGGGFEGFCDKFGDYYVSGYRFGGDTGLMISASGHSREESESLSVNLTVKVLFIKVSRTWSKEFESFASGRSLKLLGYDTLDGKNWKEYSAAADDVAAMRQWAKDVEPSPIESLIADADAVMERSQNLVERIGEVLEKHGALDGSTLTFQQCEELIKAGVVVEIMLQPVSRLRDVARWRNEHDVI